VVDRVREADDADLDKLTQSILDATGPLVSFGATMTAVASAVGGAASYIIGGWVGIGTVIGSVVEELRRFSDSDYAQALIALTRGDYSGFAYRVGRGAMQGESLPNDFFGANWRNRTADRVDRSAMPFIDAGNAMFGLAGGAVGAVMDPEAWAESFIESWRGALREYEATTTRSNAALVTPGADNANAPSGAPNDPVAVEFARPSSYSMAIRGMGRDPLPLPDVNTRVLPQGTARRFSVPTSYEQAGRALYDGFVERAARSLPVPDVSARVLPQRSGLDFMVNPPSSYERAGEVLGDAFVERVTRTLPLPDPSVRILPQSLPRQFSRPSSYSQAVAGMGDRAEADTIATAFGDGPNPNARGGRYVFSGLGEDIADAGETFRAQQSEAAREFATTVVNAGSGFVGAIEQFRSGDIGGGISSLGGVASSIATLIPGGAAIAPLISAGAGLLGGLFSLGQGSGESPAANSAQSSRALTRLELNFTVNQDIDLGLLDDPQTTAKFQEWNKIAFRQFEDVVKRNINPRLDALEARI